MIQKITLESVEIKSFDKNKNGDPYEMAFVKYDGGKEASMYLAKVGDDKQLAWTQKNKEMIEELKEGEQTVLKLEKNGNYMNFKFPGRNDLLEARIETLEEGFEKMKNYLKEKLTKLK